MDTEYYFRLVKHLIKKTINRPDPSWLIYDFEHSINRQTITRQDEIIAWADEALAHKERYESEATYAASRDPLVIQGHRLKKEIEAKFRNCRAVDKSMRILMHIPGEEVSPGAYSALLNLAESLQFIGVPTRTCGTGDVTEKILREFTPTILLVVDHAIFLKEIQWPAVAAYAAKQPISVGLLAQLAEDGNSALGPRLAWGKKHNVAFYFSFKDAAFISQSPSYQPFRDAGCEIISVPFGGNPLHYYPVAGVERDLDYVFLGSINRLKAPLYYHYARTIVKKYIGLIFGPGWKHVQDFKFNRDQNRFLYARAKVALNFHNPICWENEINERTHQLAMHGIAQLVDAPSLLPSFYAPDMLFMAESGKEFQRLFREIINNPQEGVKRALKAQWHAFAEHTTFHRAEKFADELKKRYYRSSHV